jgi:hypothetical protein
MGPLMCIQMRLVPFFGFIGATSGVHTSVTHQRLGQRANSLAQHIAILRHMPARSQLGPVVVDSGRVTAEVVLRGWRHVRPWRRHRVGAGSESILPGRTRRSTPKPSLCLPPPSMRRGIVFGNLAANASGPLTRAL